MNNVNVDQILSENSGLSNYTLWCLVVRALEEAGVKPVPPTEGEKEYGMEDPLPFTMDIFGKQYRCTVEKGDSFHYPGSYVVVVYNRTLDRVQKRAYWR